MKKILAVILVLCMLFTSCIAMASCSNTNSDGDGTTASNGDDTTTSGGDDTTAPGEDGTTVPGEDDTTVPGEDGTTVPGEDGTTVPGEDGTDNPGEVTSNDPGDDPLVPADPEELEAFVNRAPELLESGFASAMTSFYDVAGVIDMLNGMEKGAIHITVDNAMLLEELGVGKLKESFYFDITGGEFNGAVSDTTVEIDGETLGAIIALDKKVVGVAGNAIFGDSESAYKLDIANIIENFKNSELKSILEEDGMDAEAYEEVLNSMELFLEEWNSAFDFDVYRALGEDMRAWMIDLLDELDPVAKEDVLNGETVVTVAYTISNETVSALIDKLFDTIPDSYYEYMIAQSHLDVTVEAMKEQVAAGKGDVLASLEAMPYTFNVTLSFSFAKDDESLVAINLLGNLDGSSEDYVAMYDPTMEILFFEDKITTLVGVEVTQGVDKFEAYANETLVRTEEDGTVIIKDDIDVYGKGTNVDTGESEEHLLADIVTLEIKYHRASGSFSVKGAVSYTTTYYEYEEGELVDSYDEEINYSAGIEGNLIVNEGKVTLIVSTVDMNGYVLTDLGVTVVIDTAATLPAISEDAKELLGMTEEELYALVESVMNSPLGQLIESMQPEESIELYGCYESELGDAFYFESDWFGYASADGEDLSGHYYIEDGGSTLVLEYWNESTEEWVYSYFDFVNKIDFIYIDDVAYYYVEEDYGDTDYLAGTYADETESVFYYFDGYDYFEFCTVDETIMAGYYEVYSDYDAEGYLTDWLYLEWEGEEGLRNAEYVIGLYDNVIEIDGIKYFYVDYYEEVA